MNEENKHYRVSGIEKLAEKVNDFIAHHEKLQVPRLQMLEDYYNGNNVSILTGIRRNEEMVADHRLTHPYAEYVTNYTQGYTFGQPIKLGLVEDEERLEPLNDINERNDLDTLNSELGLDLGIYGRAYELVYYNEHDQFRIIRLDPKQTFVVYDDTVESYSIAAVRYYTNADDELTVEIYTTDEIYRYVGDAAMDIQKHQPTEVSTHRFGSVPINEYENNRSRQGDYEKVLKLIDAYDAAQSDLANYSEDLNDSLLKITGDVRLSPDMLDEMRSSRILLLNPATTNDGKEGSVDADYIYKKYDADGAEKYKERLNNDIHAFTATPNMHDDKVGVGAQSGVAMKYKMFNLEQKRINKIRSFTKSLRRRYRLIIQLKDTINDSTGIEAEELRFYATPNYPIDVKEEIKTLVESGAELSLETMLNLTPLDIDATEEISKIESQRPQMANYPDFEE